MKSVFYSEEPHTTVFVDFFFSVPLQSSHFKGKENMMMSYGFEKQMLKYYTKTKNYSETI